MARILIVDDDASMRLALAEVLRKGGFEATTADGADGALRELSDAPHALLVSDMRMPGTSGRELLREVRSRHPGLPVVMMTAYGTVEDAVAAMKAGAREFLTKPFSPRDLLHVVEDILRDPAPPSPLDADARDAHGDDAATAGAPPAAIDRRIVSRSPAMARVLEIADAVAASRAPVLVQGESGTGKELLARYLHERGPWRAQPFVAVNCAALPRELLESELFGHERGAFTGAVARKLGKFELAQHGTILLDEISEMEPALQAKLLRVLQEREIDRVGGSRPIPMAARVVATTNRDLRAMVATGAFRRDLYYRLHVVPIALPALRERPEDIELLVSHFAARFAGARKPSFEASALARLREHAWPGNIRELEHVVERAVLLARGNAIDGDELQIDDEPERPAPAAAVSGLAGRTVHEVERELIFATLKRTNNNRSHAARMLGISVRTLRNKLAEYRGAGLLEAGA
ncbi:MAG TPA: sigma-54 dependent transcriptional regulator [Candidatus Binatia bacterium]|nr:sigma-54 dependent transcriptional regulator [Candidatus Binatia bacterium]